MINRNIHSKKKKLLKFVFQNKSALFATLIIAAGIVLRCWEFFSSKCLDVDEAMLLLTLRSVSWNELLSPLPGFQIIPLGFLLLTKTLVTSIGAGVLAIRSVSFVAGVLSILIFVKLIKIIFNRVPLMPLSLFSFAYPLIWYSSNIRQYGIEVFFCTIISLLGVQVIKKPTGKNILLFSSVALFAPYFSHASIFVITSAYCSFFYQILQGKVKNSYKIILSILFSIISLLFNFIFLAKGIHYLTQATTKTTLPYLAGLFPPKEIGIKYFHWVFNALTLKPLAYFLWPDNLTAWIVFSLLVYGGLFRLFKTDKAIAVLFSAPFILTIFSTLICKYSFSENIGRTILFLIPFAFILVYQSHLFILSLLRKKTNTRYVKAFVQSIYNIMLVVLLLFPIYTNTIKHVFHEKNDDFRVALKTVLAISKHEEPIVVYGMDISSMAYWRSILPINNDIVFLPVSKKNTPLDSLNIFVHYLITEAYNNNKALLWDNKKNWHAVNNFTKYNFWLIYYNIVQFGTDSDQQIIRSREVSATTLTSLTNYLDQYGKKYEQIIPNNRARIYYYAVYAHSVP